MTGSSHHAEIPDSLTHCFSTNHNLGYCYDDARVIRRVWKQAVRGFQGVTGSFD